jgi:LppP/LprE lipoprotein
MSSTIVHTTSLIMAIVACYPGSARPQIKSASWLDEAKPASWNEPSLPIPAAPSIQGDTNPRCKELARPPQLQADERLRERRWQLVGAYQGGWQILVIRGTAGYDGMCRPRQYQDFVFVRDAFVGTLSPQPVDSRTDGALGRVFIESGARLTVEYERYGASDPLCCPSRTTRVVFEIASNTLLLQPVSASTSAKK